PRPIVKAALVRIAGEEIAVLLPDKETLVVNGICRYRHKVREQHSVGSARLRTSIVDLNACAVLYALPGAYLGVALDDLLGNRRQRSCSAGMIVQVHSENTRYEWG